MTTLRTLARRTLIATAWSLASVVSAQDFPSKPINFVNSFPPGGPSDMIARSIAEVLQQRFKQPVVVENKPGAAVNIGTAQVAQRPDGHTVLIGIDTTFCRQSAHLQRMPFKPADFKPLMVIASSGLLVGAHPSTGFKTLADPGQRRQDQGRDLQLGRLGQPGPPGGRCSMRPRACRSPMCPTRGQHARRHAVLSGEVNGGVRLTRPAAA